MKQWLFGFGIALLALSPLTAEEQETEVVGTEVVETQVAAEEQPADEQPAVLAFEGTEENNEVDVNPSYPRRCRRCNAGKNS